MIGGVIIAHKDFGESLLRVITSIAGKFEHLASISNDGLSTSELVREIKRVSESMDVDGLFLFVDVFGGSCWQATKMAKLGKAHIVAGISLPMLLSFCHKRETVPFDELSGILETDASRGVRID